MEPFLTPTVEEQAGEQFNVVAERLGHADPTVTASIYAHVTPKQRAEAAETYALLIEGGQ